MKVQAIIPAYNEATRISKVIKEVKKHVDGILVIDDHSEDNTKKVAEKAGAEVFRKGKNEGFLKAVKTGFRKAKGDVLVTIDADGEFRGKGIPKLLKEIESGADLVLGVREKYHRGPLERFFNFLTSLKYPVTDSGTGFRAIRKEIAKNLELKGKCACGILVLEALQVKNDVDIREVEITTKKVNKKKRIPWKHVIQLFYILKKLLIS